jgi:hypothetical protein
MSIVFIECPTFFKEFPELAYQSSCCKNCHAEQRNLIYVRPFRDGVYRENTDWYLCVEAIVCCGIYDFVRKLPREWWVGKSREFGVNREDLERGYIYPDSPARNTVRPRVAGQTSNKAAAPVGRKPRRALTDDEEPEGFGSWLRGK